MPYSSRSTGLPVRRLAGMPAGFRRPVAGLLGSVLAGLLWGGAPGAQAQLRYDTEYPEIGYGKTLPDDGFSRLLAGLEAKGESLTHDGTARGFLEALLQALDIDASSQVLVFSKSSLKQRFITPANPRALYFNDDVYVGFVPGSRSLEIAAMDPQQGAVFFDLDNTQATPLTYKQETSRCLRCHDSYSLTGGGVPRFLLSSEIAGPDGAIVSHELSEITDVTTPLERRFGGWYVSGLSGNQIHLGNLIVRDPSQLAQRPWQGVLNQQTLTAFADLAAYPRATSDIVALLVLQHQVDFQNRLIRLNFDSRQRLASDPAPSEADLQALLKPVLAALFMADEAPLAATVTGNSGYQQWFEQQGPRAADGRSLRELDLATRTFKHRLSFQIYSRAVDALAEPVKALLFADIRAVLAGNETLLPGLGLSAAERSTLGAILRDTKPEVLAGP